MNLVDFLVWAVLLAFAVKGFVKGLIREICSLFAVVIGVWAATHFHADFSVALNALIRLPRPVSVALSFILIFLVTSLVFVLFGHLLTAVSRLAMLGGINRIGGVIFGGLQGAVLLCVILYGVHLKGMPEKLRQSVATSKAGSVFAVSGGEMIAGWIPHRTNLPRETIPRH